MKKFLPFLFLLIEFVFLSNSIFAECLKCKKVELGMGVQDIGNYEATGYPGTSPGISGRLKLKCGAEEVISSEKISNQIDNNVTYEYWGGKLIKLSPFEKRSVTFTIGSNNVYDAYESAGLGLASDSCYRLFFDQQKNVGIQFVHFFGEYSENIWGDESNPLAYLMPGTYEFELRPAEKSGGGFKGGSISWYSSFGNNPDGSYIGSLNVYQENITDALFSPSCLISTVNEADVRNEVIKEGTNLRQIKTLQSLADILTLSSTRFEVRFYLPSQVGAKIGSLYSVSGTPKEIWIFEKPAASTSTRPQFLGTRIKGSINRTFLATQDIPGNSWTFDEESGQKIQSHQTIENTGAGTRQEIYTASERQSNGTLKLVSKTVEYYQNFPWESQELISTVKDPDGANLITTYVYYTDTADTANYGKQKAVINPDGSWEKYVYYSQTGGFFGREWKTYRPYLSSPATYDQASDANCKVTEVQYGYYNSIFPEYTSFEKETTNGVVTSQKTWQQYEEPYTAPSGQVYNTLVKNEFSYYGPGLTQYTWNKSQSYTKIDQGSDLDPLWLQGKTACVTTPDGRKEIYWYEPGTWNGSTFTPNVDGTAWRESVTHARNATPSEIVNETTKSITIRDNIAYLVREETQIYTASGYQLLSHTDYTNDTEGNPTEVRKEGRVIQTSLYTDGLKTSETDETGITTEYAYDDLGNQISSTKKGVSAGTGYQAQPDILTTYTVDATGRQTGQVVTAGALTQTTSSTYDVAGRLETETSNGLTTWHSYWSGGLFHQVTSPNGATQITESYLDGKIKSVTGSGVIPQYYSYLIDSSASQLGFQTTTVRTGSGNDPQYESTTQDLLGRTVLVQRPGFNGTTWQQQSIYNDLGQLIKTTQTGSTDQLTTYNAFGEVLLSGLDINGDGALTSASTDRFSETTTDYSLENSVWYRINTTKQYLKDGQSTASTTIQKEALSGTPQTILYDALGNITKTTTTIDRDGKTVTQTTDTPDSTIDAVSVTVNGLLVSQSSNSNSAASLFHYDSLGRQTETIQQDGVMTSQTYNANGQIETQKDAANNVTTIEYYAQTELGAGQPKLVTQPDNTTILYQYDSLGNKTREWGSATYPVDYEYNEKGQRTKMFTYRSLGAVGNKSQGDLTVWAYDPATGLLLSKTDATNKSTLYTYHPSGQLKTRLWARGITTTYDYNGAGELSSVDYSDTTPDVTMNYDRSGQPTTITDGSGTRTFSSTTNALPTGFAYTAGELNTLSVGYTYDGIGRMDSITAGGRPTNYGYRGEGRLGTVTHQGSTATYGYKPNSDLIQSTTYSSGAGTRLTTTRNYDSSDRIGSVVNVPGTGSTISRSYNYNSRNQRITSTLANGDYWNYDYNSKGEVTSGTKKNSANANLLGHEYAYLFDEIGNRTQTTINSKQSIYTSNTLNQYDQRTIPPFTEILGSANTASTVTVNNQSTQRQADLFFVQLPADNSVAPVYSNNSIVGVRNNADTSGNDALQNSSVKKIVPKTPEAFVYDFDGNVTSDGRFNYTWDGENRLIKIESVISAPAADKKQINFIYDAQSRRVSKKSYTWSGTAWVLADSRRFLYDQFNLLAEINDTGAVLNSYAWGTDLSGSLYGAGGVGGLLFVANSNVLQNLSTVESPAYDANGNILAYVSNTGAVTAQFEYGPFGELIRSSGTPPCNFGFSTKYRDSETGLNYYGYRYYNSNLGRWLGRDPIEEQGGLNLYGMVGNDGVNNLDYLGQKNYKIAFFGAGSRGAQGNSDFTSIIGTATSYNWNEMSQALQKLLGDLDSNHDKVICTNEVEGNTVRLIGYSYGGTTAANMSFKLFVEKGKGEKVEGYDLVTKVPIEELITIDPVTFARPVYGVKDNVQYFFNLYQKRGGNAIIRDPRTGKVVSEFGSFLSRQIQGSTIPSSAPGIQIRLDTSSYKVPFYKGYVLSNESNHDLVPWFYLKTYGGF